jgi:hypothetical protein
MWWAVGLFSGDELGRPNNENIETLDAIQWSRVASGREPSLFSSSLVARLNRCTVELEYRFWRALVEYRESD